MCRAMHTPGLALQTKASVGLMLAGSPENNSCQALSVHVSMAPAEVASMSLDMDEDEKLFSEEAICLSESVTNLLCRALLGWALVY